MQNLELILNGKVKELEYVLGISDTAPSWRGRTLDLPRYELDNKVRAELIGENEDQKEAQEFLTGAFGVALF